MNIYMVASESNPFYKTGGLADVVYSLSKEYVKNKQHVFIVLPMYRNLEKADMIDAEIAFNFDVSMSWRTIPTRVFKIEREKITYYFIENRYYFERNAFYGFMDDGERYAYFNLATIELLKRVEGKVDVVHVHDWQSGMLPCLLKIKYAEDKKLGKTKSVLTIHNPMFKGYFGSYSLYDLYELPYWIYENGSVRFDEMCSSLKAGIIYSDKVTTVSPTHAYELTTREGGFGFHYILTLRRDDFVGILNGMDYGEFDPSKDKSIYQKYDPEHVSEGKFANKAAFFNEYGHGNNPEQPLFSVVSRLSEQKGLDLINAMANYIVRNNGVVAILGSGDAGEEEYLNNLARDYPANAIIYIGYSDPMAHKIYAASDFLLMPSQFEPCGLSQMISQRYGTLPLVRRTGGLADSVRPYWDEANNIEEADGLGFDDYSTYAACKTVKFAFEVYNNKEIFDRLRQNAFKVDNTWAKSAKKYLDLYKSINK